MNGRTSLTVGLDEDEVGRMLDLVESDAGGTALVERALATWRRVLGTEGMAAYLPTGDGFSRCAVTGGGIFPATVEALEEAEFPSRRTGGGLVLSSEGFDRAGGSSPADEPVSAELLVAAALRMRQLERRVRQRDFEARYRGVEMEVLNELGSAIATSLDMDELSEGVLLRAVSLLDARRGALYLRRDDDYELAAVVGGSAAERIGAEWVAELDADEILPGSRHLLVAPIEIEQERRGVLAVADKESRVGVGPFGDSDRRSLALFAGQAALAIEQARLHREAIEKERLEREMELASEIQLGILPPSVPELDGFDLLAWTRPARHVGGDYHDLIPIGPSASEDTSTDGLAVVLADVTGKGVPAALLVSTLHAALRLLVDRNDDHSELCRRLNRHLVEFSATNKFATMFLAELRTDEDAVRFVNAGHDPAFLVRADGEVERLGATGVPLGLFPAAAHDTRSISLDTDDLLCLYSDGLTEATNRRDEEFGSERLGSLLTAARKDPLDEIRAAVESALREFTDGVPQGDDQTLVLVRRV